jgi:hypothetical protein
VFFYHLTSNNNAPLAWRLVRAVENPESEKKILEDKARKKQKVLAQVKRVHPGLMARNYGFFSTQTSLV